MTSVCSPPLGYSTALWYRRGQNNVLPPGIQGRLPPETVDCAAYPDLGGPKTLVALKVTQVRSSGTAYHSRW